LSGDARIEAWGNTTLIAFDKANCNVCHQMGNQATREIPKALGTFPAYKKHAQEAKIVEKSSGEYYGDEYQDITHRVPSIRRARELLGWEPKVGFEEAILRTIAYYVETSEDTGRAKTRHA